MQGKVVFITGAARGIGAAAARSVTARGGRVALVGLEGEELERTAASCGPDALAVEADVTDPLALERAVAATRERFGGIDAVVANAGIGAGGFVRLSDPDAFEATIEVNLLGVYRTLHACLPSVLERRGYLLSVASLAAALHSPGMGAYAASKAGVEALGDCMRTELRHHGVAVGVAYFSFIDTDMVRGTDASPVGAHMRKRLRGPIARTFPVALTGEAIADGIEQRRRRVVVPRWLPTLLVGRTLIQPVQDRLAAREVPAAEQIAERDVAERGIAAASAPVGAGGEAAARARQAR